MFEVRSVCQSFYCRALDADRGELEAALIDLARVLPAAASIQEIEMLTDLLRTCTTDAGVRFHQDYHRRSRQKRCAGSPVEQAMHVWGQYNNDSRVMLQCWTIAFLQVFDATHQIPPAEKAATILRKRFGDPPGLSALAVEVGVSRNVLARSFRDCYQMSGREYLARVRLRWFIERVRMPGSNATRLAREAGYESYHNLIHALRQRTGFTPSEIRQMESDVMGELHVQKLSLARGGDSGLAAARKPLRSTAPPWLEQDSVPGQRSLERG
jgi:AraC-like DNA-binding protein